MPRPLLVVHLIHGTWGRGVLPVILEELGRSAGPKPVYWFEDGSVFRAELARQLEGHEVEFREFKWSGSNSFGARTFAATALHEYLEPELERKDTRHVLIGHSHAGNVIFEMLTRMKPLKEEAKIDGVLSLATPYLAIETDTSDSALLLHLMLPFLLGGYVLGLMAFNALIGYWDIFGWLAGSAAGYALGIARLQPGSRWRWPRELLFWAVALSTAACVGHAVLPWFATTYPPASFWAHAVKWWVPALALLLATTHLALLVAARAAGSTPRGTFLLRDLVQAFSAMFACVVLVAGAAHAAMQPTVASDWFLIFLGGWPFGALIVAHLWRRNEDPPREAILDVWRAAERELEKFTLPCDIRAMRLAGDEATLAIVASQIARALNSVPKQIYVSLDSWSPRTGIAVSAFVLAFGVGVGYMQFSSLETEWLRWAVGTVVGSAAICILLIAAVLLTILVSLMLATLSYGLVGLAVGTDLFDMLPAARVACESLPRGAVDQSNLTLLWPNPEERKHLSLRHSMYDLPAVQLRVGQWLKERVAEPSSPPSR